MKHPAHAGWDRFDLRKVVVPNAISQLLIVGNTLLIVAGEVDAETYIATTDS